MPRSPSVERGHLDQLMKDWDTQPSCLLPLTRPGRVQMGGDEGVNYARAVAMEGGKGGQR